MGNSAWTDGKNHLYKTANICCLAAVVFFCVFLYSLIIQPGSSVDPSTRVLEDNLFGQISSGRWYFIGISVLTAVMGLSSRRKGDKFQAYPTKVAGGGKQ